MTADPATLNNTAVDGVLESVVCLCNVPCIVQDIELWELLLDCLLKLDAFLSTHHHHDDDDERLPDPYKRPLVCHVLQRESRSHGSSHVLQCLEKGIKITRELRNECSRMVMGICGVCPSEFQREVAIHG